MWLKIFHLGFNLRGEVFFVDLSELDEFETFLACSSEYILYVRELKTIFDNNKNSVRGSVTK